MKTKNNRPQKGYKSIAAIQDYPSEMFNVNGVRLSLQDARKLAVLQNAKLQVVRFVDFSKPV
jgi:hypothetical protein